MLTAFTYFVERREGNINLQTWDSRSGGLFNFIDAIQNRHESAGFSPPDAFWVCVVLQLFEKAEIPFRHNPGLSKCPVSQNVTPTWSVQARNFFIMIRDCRETGKSCEISADDPHVGSKLEQFVWACPQFHPCNVMRGANCAFAE